MLKIIVHFISVLRSSRDQSACAIFAPLCFLIGGCGPASPEFQTIDYNKIELGHTTRHEVIAMTGEPVGRGTIQLPSTLLVLGQWIELRTCDPRVVIDEYHYPYNFLQRGSMKNMGVIYYDNTVVDYSFFNPLVFYKRSLDASQIRCIEKGKTSEAELLRLMGPPDSASLLHMTSDSREVAKRLSWAGGAGGVTRVLLVSLDDHHTVRDVVVSRIHAESSCGCAAPATDAKDR